MKVKVNTLTKIAVLSALSYIFMLFEFPIPLMPPFLKIDFSEIPVLLAAFAIGPFSAIFVELVKNLLHLFNSQTSGIGEMANFLVGVSYVVPAGLLYKYYKNRKGALVALSIGTIIMVACASLLNYFVLLPLYASVLHFSTDAVIGMGTQVNKNIVDVKTFIAFAIVPFNIFKGIVVSIIVAIIYKKLSPILHKK